MTAVRTTEQRRADALARMRAAIAEVEAELRGYAEAHGGRFVIFGSVARGDFAPDSDLDVLVDFPEPIDLDARRIAERACAARGLVPDVVSKLDCSQRLLDRIERDLAPGPGPDPRWTDVAAGVETARRHLTGAIDTVAEGWPHGSDLEAVTCRYAFLHAVQLGYGGVESALKRCLRIVGEPLETAPEPGTALADQAVRATPDRPAILAPTLSDPLHRLRQARDRALNPATAFDRETVEAIVGAARQIGPAIGPQVAAFKAAVDPD